MEKIKRAIFNDPATVVYWQDGTKTVVKCQEGDIYDAEKGIMACMAKKSYGNNNTYNKEIDQAFNPKPVEQKVDKLGEFTEE